MLKKNILNILFTLIIIGVTPIVFTNQKAVSTDDLTSKKYQSMFQMMLKQVQSLKFEDPDSTQTQYEHGNKAYNDNEYQIAFKLFQKAGLQGHLEAQFYVGYLYYYGKGVMQNYTKASKWFELAATQGHSEGQFYLGKLYQLGQGVIQNDYYAAQWFFKAAQQGDINAQAILGEYYATGRGVVPDDKEAVKWLKNAADQGHAEAQNNLGNLYVSGRGVKQSDFEAVKLFSQAAEQRNARAQYNLAYMYYNGKGVEKDYYNANKWYLTSARQGFSEAQYLMGWMHAEGIGGVKQNDRIAKKWFIRVINNPKTSELVKTKAKETLAKLYVRQIEYSSQRNHYEYSTQAQAQRKNGVLQKHPISDNRDKENSFFKSQQDDNEVTNTQIRY